MQPSDDQLLVLEVKGPSGQTSLFIKLEWVFPECSFLIKDADNLYPLFCLKNSYCPRNASCMDKLAKRVKYIFDHFPNSEVLYLYFRYRDLPNSQRAGVFWKDLREPTYITFNKTAWEKFKNIGTVYEWRLPDSLFLS